MKGKSKVRILTMVLMLVLILPGTSIAAVSQDNQSYDLATAKEYLMNYEEVNYNQFGEKYIVSYTFETEDDLNGAAAYIVENGIESFHKMLDIGVTRVADAEKKEEETVISRTADPSFVAKTVSGNGSHYVSDRTVGLCDFGNFGTVQYLIEFGFSARVENQQFVSVGNVNFDMLSISTGGGYEDLSFPEYCTPNGAGITANYCITKRVVIPFPGSDIDVGALVKKDYDSFGIAVTLE